MKKIIFSISFLFLVNTICSQELHVTSTATYYISPEAYTWVGDNVNVANTANLTVASSATDSGSFIVPGASTVGGNITYQRFIPTTGWHLVSSPVVGQNIESFATDAANDITTKTAADGLSFLTAKYAISYYDNILARADRWVYYNNENITAAGNFTTAQGYQMKRNSTGFLTFTGTMNVDALAKVTVPTSFYAGDGTQHLWAVVGNPFPSFLPATDLANGTNNILKQNLSNLDASRAYILILDATDNKYYYYNHVVSKGSLTFDGTLGAGSTTPWSIAPGQAFFMDPIDNNTDLFFPENLQTPQPAATNATFLRTTPIEKVNVKLSNDSETKATMIYYIENGTDGLDPGYDAAVFEEGTPTFGFYTHLVSDSSGNNFMLQCLPNVDQDKYIIPLSVYAAANQKLTFTTDTENLPAGTNVYLEDKLLNTITDITTASHQVTIDSALNGIGRFYLRTSSNSLSTGDNSLSTSFNMYKTTNTNLRITGLQQTGTALIKMYTVTGKQVLSSSFEIQTVNDVTLPVNLARGVYLVNLQTNQAKQTKKIIIE